MLEKIPADIHALISGIAGLIPTAVLARFLYYRRMVKQGNRRFWSIDLLWEIPTAAFSAIIGGGLAAYLSLGLPEANAIVGVCAWLGPRGMEVALARIGARYMAKEK